MLCWAPRAEIEATRSFSAFLASDRITSRFGVCSSITGVGVGAVRTAERVSCSATGSSLVIVVALGCEVSGIDDSCERRERPIPIVGSAGIETRLNSCTLHRVATIPSSLCSASSIE